MCVIFSLPAPRVLACDGPFRKERTCGFIYRSIYVCTHVHMPRPFVSPVTACPKCEHSTLVGKPRGNLSCLTPGSARPASNLFVIRVGVGGGRPVWKRGKVGEGPFLLQSVRLSLTYDDTVLEQGRESLT